jgi:hypothetical protein
MEQLAKTLLQREVEQVHEMLVQLRLPRVAKQTQEEEQNTAQFRDILENKFEELTAELESLMRRTAKRSIEMEQVRLEVARSQRLLDELSERELQLGFAPMLAPAATASSSPAQTVARFVPAPLTPEQFQQVVMELDNLRREVGKLQAENVELNKQLEQSNDVIEPQESGGSHVARTPLLKAGDQVEVTFISDEPRESGNPQIFTINSAGQIRLGDGPYSGEPMEITGLDTQRAAKIIMDSLPKRSPIREVQVRRIEPE